MIYQFISPDRIETQTMLEAGTVNDQLDTFITRAERNDKFPDT